LKHSIFARVDTINGGVVFAHAEIEGRVVFSGYAASSVKFEAGVSMPEAPVHLRVVTCEVGKRLVKALDECKGDVLALHAAARKIIASYEDLFDLHIAVTLTMKVTNAAEE
jgi:hypothetical protein